MVYFTITVLVLGALLLVAHRLNTEDEATINAPLPGFGGGSKEPGHTANAAY